MYKNFIALSVALLLGALSSAAERTPVLVELFTSQGCYSCPPAEALLRDEYARRDDLVALEFHVDYWNELVYGDAGRWADPFSDARYTRRQRAYNLSLRDRAGGYTPQMVVQGRHQEVGSRKARINRFIAEESDREPTLKFVFSGRAENGYSARVEGQLQGDEDLYYAVYHLEENTVIPSGENKGKTLISRNIVKALRQHPASRGEIILPAIDPAAEGCAVWVQEQDTGAVLGVARCPSG